MTTDRIKRRIEELRIESEKEFSINGKSSRYKLLVGTLEVNQDLFRFFTRMQ